MYLHDTCLVLHRILRKISHFSEGQLHTSMVTDNNGPADAVPPPFAEMALDLTDQDWTRLGLDPGNENLNDADLLDSLVERVTSLLLVRVVAVLVNGTIGAPVFADLSSRTICRTVLMQQKPWIAYAPQITSDFLQQLRSYVRTILAGYNDTPYHSKEHAFHVVLSVNKLTDLMLKTNPGTIKTYGLRHDAVAQLAMVFAALVHDVEHTGVPNRQLVLENDLLSVLYNDQSVAEQRSLFIAFDELLKPEYSLLRSTIFNVSDGKMDSDSYRRFRKIVVDLVLNTDIASPERTQLAKSKWREGFGDTFESMERKLKQTLNEQDDDGSISGSETPDSSENEKDADGEPQRDNSYNVSISDMGYEISGENDGVIMSGSTRSATKKTQAAALVNDVKNASDASNDGKELNNSRRLRPSRLHSMPMARRSSVQLLLQSDELCKAKFQRRMSSYAAPVATVVRPEGFRMRLGIRRTMDLGGESIVAYPKVAPVATDVDDDPDELKASVVMETIMTAADVAHNLQGWGQMVIWSGRLYMEVRKAYVEGRGGDPQFGWFENQIGFLESYLLPLARRLEDTGVFGESMGQAFAAIVEANRNKWFVDGKGVTDAIIAKGAETYNKELITDERKLSTELNKTRAAGKGGHGLKFRTSNLAIVAATVLAISLQINTNAGK